MELKDLQPMVLMLVLIALIVGVGVLVIDKFGEAVKDSTSLNETVTFTNSVGVTVQGTTANNDVTSITSIINGTGTRATYDSTSYNFTTVGVINLDPVSTVIINETVSISSSVGQLGHNNITSIQSIANRTGILSTPVDLTTWLNTGVNWTTAGVITTNASLDVSTMYFNYTYNQIALGSHDVTYIYDKDSRATTTLASSATAVGSVSTDWLSLIVTIMILSFILFMVIKSFAVKAR